MLINGSLAGSGMLYPGYIGALWCLHDYGFRLQEIATCSGGSITGGAIASGYDPGEDLVRLVLDTLPWENKLFDIKLRNLKNLGIIKGDLIESEIAKYLLPKMGDAKIPLYISGTNMTKMKNVIFSSFDTPDMAIAKAIRISMGLPFVFTQAEYNGDLHIDGGITNNSPVSVFKNDSPIIAISFTNTGQKAKSFIARIFGYLGDLITLMVDSNRRKPINELFELKLTPGYSGMNFFLNKDDVKKIVDISYKQTELWLVESKEREEMRNLWDGEQERLAFPSYNSKVRPQIHQST